MALARIDAALRRRSTIAWVTFRAVVGVLVAAGLASWLFVWFERNFWLGAAQAVMCGLVLANELGMLRRPAVGSGSE